MRLSALLLFITYCSAQTSTVPQKLGEDAKVRFTIATRNSQVKVGEPLWVTTELMNVSSEVVKICETNPEYQYQVEVKTVDHKPVPLSRRGEEVRAEEYPITVSKWCTDTLPGKKVLNHLDVARLYELQPGTIEIKMTRTTLGKYGHDRQTPFTSSSNTLTVVVTP